MRRKEREERSSLKLHILSHNDKKKSIELSLFSENPVLYCFSSLTMRFFNIQGVHKFYSQFLKITKKADDEIC